MEKKNSLVHSFSGENTPLLSPLLVGIIIVFVLLGVGTGYLIAHNTNSPSPTSNTATQGSPTNTSSVKVGASYGSTDTSTFKDTAEGTLQKGGIDGEGQYHLVRPGGGSQNVYMTSSVVDLSMFVGRKVKVWGQTQSAQHAGWLMDVGKVEVEQ